MTVVSADFDEDGDVDSEDLDRWIAGFGLLNDAIHNSGDADGDMDVDGADFLAWQQNIRPGIGLSSNATVPDPTLLCCP